MDNGGAFAATSAPGRLWAESDKLRARSSAGVFVGGAGGRTLLVRFTGMVSRPLLSHELVVVARGPNRSSEDLIEKHLKTSDIFTSV